MNREQKAVAAATAVQGGPHPHSELIFRGRKEVNIIALRLHLPNCRLHSLLRLLNLLA